MSSFSLSGGETRALVDDLHIMLEGEAKKNETNSDVADTLEQSVKTGMGELISKGLALNSQNRSVAGPSPVTTNVLTDSLPCNAEEKKREKDSCDVNVDTFPQQLNSKFTTVNEADMDTQKYSEDGETNSDCLSSTIDNEPKLLLLNEELNEPQTDTQMSVTTDEISSSQSERKEAHCSTVQTSKEAVCETSCSDKSDNQREEYSDQKISEDTADVNVSGTENQGALPSDSLLEKYVTLDDAFEEANSEHDNQILSTEVNNEASSVESTESKRGYPSFSRGRPRKEKMLSNVNIVGALSIIPQHILFICVSTQVRSPSPARIVAKPSLNNPTFDPTAKSINPKVGDMHAETKIEPRLRKLWTRTK